MSFSVGRSRTREPIHRLRVTILPCQATRVEWQVLFIAEDESGIVLTERIDIFEFGVKRVALPVMGTFEFEGDKLKRWRDYFDLGDFETQMAALQD